MDSYHRTVREAPIAQLTKSMCLRNPQHISCDERRADILRSLSDPVLCEVSEHRPGCNLPGKSIWGGVERGVIFVPKVPGSFLGGVGEDSEFGGGEADTAVR
jgi:hypothetical protein